MKRIIFALTLILGVTMTGFAQSDKIKEKATEKVEELNKEIVAGDESLALSEEQKKQVYDIHVKRIMEYRKVRKAGASKEEQQAVQKKYFSQIFKDVLTKEQMKARKEGKKKLQD
ncbi:hypothetical protein ACFQ1Q_03270 [Winogradskyella litorisediminis]|uniref:LTXXQ motif family protein n=1 Tax=Winogradskyella litorisediminis TaxID=1156618 RepID=A0ABW3N3W0_9FLAO